MADMGMGWFPVGIMSRAEEPLRIAIILGAGASAPYGLPTLGTLPEAIRDFVGSTTDRRFHSIYEASRRVWLNLYGQDINVEWVDYERVLGLFDYLARTDGSVLLRDTEPPDICSPELIRALATEFPQLVYCALQHAYTKNPANALRHTLHEDFLDRLVMRARRGREVKDIPDITVISLNYDGIIDDEITDHMKTFYPRGVLRGQERKEVIDYLPDYVLDVVWATKLQYWRQGTSMPYLGGGHHHLIKLHGSFDWRICTHCDGVHFLRLWDPHRMAEEEGRLSEEEQNKLLWMACSRCGGMLTHGRLVAPILGKTDSAISSTLWKAAFQRLVAAEVVYVIGCSFPPSDLAFMSLVQHAMNWNRQRPIVVYVNPSDDADLWSRARKVFQPRLVGEFREMRQTFEAFLATIDQEDPEAKDLPPGIGRAYVHRVVDPNTIEVKIRDYKEAEAVDTRPEPAQPGERGDNPTAD